MPNFIEMAHLDCAAKSEPENWWLQKVGEPNVCPYCHQSVIIKTNGSQESFRLNEESLQAIRLTYPA